MNNDASSDRSRHALAVGVPAGPSPSATLAVLATRCAGDGGGAVTVAEEDSAAPAIQPAGLDCPKGWDR